MPWKRRLHVNAMIFLTIVLSLAFGYFNGVMLDGYAVYLAIDAMFLAVLCAGHIADTVQAFVEN